MSIHRAPRTAQRRAGTFFAANALRKDSRTRFAMTTKPGAASAATNSVLERNIEALLDREEQQNREQGMQERLAAAITRFTGSLYFVYIHLAVVAFWVAVNAGWTPLEKFDPTFVLLATIASVEAIFLTSFVLITQNRMQADADRRADLDLQVSLLTEHELTRLITLVRKIAERTDVDVSSDRELDEIQRDVAPERVLDTLEKKKRQHSESE
jgi:uncharacterized membrane protein